MTLGTPNGGLPAPLLPFDALIRDFLSGKAKGTIRGYRQDLETLGSFLGTGSMAATARRVLASHGEANRIALSWRAAMVDGGYAPATVNRRLAALRSLVKLARLTGMVQWTIDVSGVTVQAYRDTRGVGWEKYQSALAEASVRDRAILSLAGDLGLRRAEIVSLDREHFDEERRSLWVLGKGKKQRTEVPMSVTTAGVLRAWLDERGWHKGAMFPGKSRGSRLSVSQVWRVCKKHACNPHGLRHTAITRALDATGGDVRAVRAFSRHADVSVVMRYDDARRDGARSVAEAMQGGER